jgi:hypothetical protein
MLDDRGVPDLDQSVNHELDWLRDIYRIVDPRFNRVTRKALERALRGLKVEHLYFVRDLNSAILEDQLDIFGGWPESYEQISLYTDYITVDDFLTHLMDEAGANADSATAEVSQNTRPSRAHEEFDGDFTWDPWRHSDQNALRVKRKRKISRYVSKLWRRS